MSDNVYNTGLENPEGAFRALASHMLPIVQFQLSAYINSDVTRNADYVLSRYRPLAVSLATHADSLMTPTMRLERLARLSACARRIADKDGVTSGIHNYAHHFAAEVDRLAKLYRTYAVERRHPFNTGAPHLTLVQGGGQ